MCDCNFDLPRVYRRETVRARKQYRCYECGIAICVGERHEAVTALYDDCWQQIRTCLDCVESRKFVMQATNCNCWLHGGLFEEITCAFEDWHAADRFGIGRRLVKFKRRANKERAHKIAA